VVTDTPRRSDPRRRSPLKRGSIIGKRYGIRSLLGRGEMGEIWRAYDLKRRIDVALRVLPVERLTREGLLEALRRALREAREVVSPHVCRVHDLLEVDGRELVATEYVRGSTLRHELEAQGALTLDEASDVAAQLLAGIEAIHRAGLVHRSITPDTVMITPGGRVVVMDLGMYWGGVQGVQCGRGPEAFLAPEQVTGGTVDARADVYSTALVLAALLPARGAALPVAADRSWRGVHCDPPRLPASPWRSVLTNALAHRPEMRYASAGALARALEGVPRCPEPVDDVIPYPGLAPFSENDRALFFGRELEGEVLWRKLRRQPLLALIGASGVGKTSFLKAGLLARQPPGWVHLAITPGYAPIPTLCDGLASQLSDDPEAMDELIRVGDPEAVLSAVARWRARAERALLVVDHFEELFTLNPPDVRRRFTAFLGRIAIDADVRVLLSMRDDFLIQCNAHESLRPILSQLTVLGPLTRSALRRAMIQPALRCGYRFEDATLADDMLTEANGERGALPLLAFAAAELWRRRNRTLGLLTREAYEVIGGVRGALAQHAELTLERIGHDRAGIVRDIFGRLVSVRGTPLPLARHELLSDFNDGDHQGAGGVLDKLIDARLLRSFADAPLVNGGDRCDRIEIAHEALLSSWPRLASWRLDDLQRSPRVDDPAVTAG
jgi:MYXO-CTERM domain-containing protein